jgi:hypothetical protein
MLLGVEITCLGLYTWQRRPGAPPTETAQPVITSEGKNWLAKLLSGDEAASPSDESPLRPFVSRFSADDLDVDTLPAGFEQMKKPGEPKFRGEEPNYHDWPLDGPMGYINRPNFRGEVQTWSYGIPNPQAWYTTDSLGRRVTGNNITQPRNRYALFLGCSITFGVMVDDRQSLPSIFERLDGTYRSYNYGVSGYGTHHLLSLFENRNLRSEVAEKDGVAFYIFFYGHIGRAIGDMDTYMSWNNNSPFYYIDGDQIKRNKDFRSGRVLISRFYEFFSKTYFCRYFDIHLPGKFRDHHYRFVARLIKEASRKYKEQFGNENFYVVLSPGWDRRIVPYLRELNLKYLDYSDSRIAPYWYDTYHFAGDGHPRPMLYKIMAERLREDVGPEINQAEQAERTTSSTHAVTTNQ